MRALHALAQELEVAEARLALGLSVRVRLARPVDLEVSRDGGEPERTADATGEHVFASEREAVVRLGDLAEVEIEAGAAHREA